MDEMVIAGKRRWRGSDLCWTSHLRVGAAVLLAGWTLGEGGEGEGQGASNILASKTGWKTAPGVL